MIADSISLSLYICIHVYIYIYLVLLFCVRSCLPRTAKGMSRWSVTVDRMKFKFQNLVQLPLGSRQRANGDATNPPRTVHLILAAAHVQLHVPPTQVHWDSGEWGLQFPQRLIYTQGVGGMGEATELLNPLNT